MNFGILSTANINGKFLDGARAAEGIEVLAVASRSSAAAQRYADEQRIPRAYGSYDDLLGDVDVQAIYIPLPNSMHVPWTLRALEAGKHVLCEKPLTRHRADAERVVAAAAQHGLQVSEAFMYRHHPQIARLVELVSGGAVGPLRAVRGHFSFNLPDGENVRLDADLDGGALMDVGCYCLSATRLLAGEPELVTAVSHVGAGGVDTRFAAALSLPGGVLAHFDCGFDFAFRHELEVVGDSGTLLLRDPFHGRAAGIEVRDGNGVRTIEIESADPYRLQAENFAAAVQGRAPLLIGGADMIAQAAAIEALYESAASGRAVAPAVQA